jgi:hypothetical protein
MRRSVCCYRYVGWCSRNQLGVRGRRGLEFFEVSAALRLAENAASRARQPGLGGRSVVPLRLLRDLQVAQHEGFLVIPTGIFPLKSLQILLELLPLRQGKIYLAGLPFPLSRSL